MKRRPLIIDTTVAALLAALASVVSPGLAITGLVALLVLLVWAITLVLEARRRRRQRALRRAVRQQSRLHT